MTVMTPALGNSSEGGGSLVRINLFDDRLEILNQADRRESSTPILPFGRMDVASLLLTGGLPDH